MLESLNDDRRPAKPGPRGRALVFVALLALGASLGAEDSLRIEPSPHKWGVELDFAWSPFELWPGRQSTLWAGVEGLYKSWQYFHDPVTGDALASAEASDAAVTEALGLWFLGASQGLLPQGSEAGPGSRPWENRNLVEAFAYYRGVYFHTLSSGSYLSDSSAPDRNGYLETAFLSGLSLDRITEPDAHGLKQGFLVEVSGAYAPRALQSIDASYARATAIAQGFLPLWDIDAGSRLNKLSLLGAANAAVDRLWGDAIPSEARQLIGGRAWAGVGGFVEGVGGAVRGVEEGRFDGTDKAVANLELRLNLPGFEVRSPLKFPLVDRTLSFLPGILAYVDGGIWRGLPGQDSGAVLSAGLGAYLTVRKYGSLAIYNDYWLAGGSPYDRGGFRWHLELGLHF